MESKFSNRNNQAVNKNEYKKIDVSIVIITYNQEYYLRKILSIIKSQKAELNFEIICVITNSNEDIERICEQYGTKIIKVKKEEFHHSKTRNLAIKECKGNFIVFLVGDAIPGNREWLENLVNPLIESHNIVGSYSKQIPFQDAPVWEKNDIQVGCLNAERLKIRNFEFYTPKDNEITKYISFSNVSACYRTEILKKYPFNENLTSCEDQEWCKRMLEKKFTIIYSPNSIVFHSHKHSLKEVIKRNFEFGKNFAKFLEKRHLWVYKNILSLFFYIGYKILKDLKFLFKNKQNGSKFGYIIKIFIFRIIEKYAFYKGAHLEWKKREII